MAVSTVNWRAWAVAVTTPSWGQMVIEVDEAPGSQTAIARAGVIVAGQFGVPEALLMTVSWCFRMDDLEIDEHGKPVFPDHDEWGGPS